MNDSEKLLMKLQDICAQLGWEMALSDEDGGIHGLIIGTEEYVQEVLTFGHDPESYELYDAGTPEELH